MTVKASDASTESVFPKGFVGTNWNGTIGKGHPSKESETPMKATNKMRVAAALLCSAVLLQGCDVGPKYNRPAAKVPATFKEVTPDDLQKMDGWKVAQPQDTALHGNWWEIFGDSQLNALEQQRQIESFG